jgi:hypothetical protein
VGGALRAQSRLEAVERKAGRDLPVVHLAVGGFDDLA